jgi:ABC-type enterochelin transport system substrate-binding protein
MIIMMIIIIMMGNISLFMYIERYNIMYQSIGLRPNYVLENINVNTKT